MAQFSNSSDGSNFDCSDCKYGEASCPIALIQFAYNYDQYKDKTGTATAIMDLLVKNDGTCTVYELMKKDLFIDVNQIKLFE